MSRVRANEILDRTLQIRVGDAVLFFYRDTLLGLQTPDGTWAASTDSNYFDVRLMKTIKARQRALGLTASWVRAVSLQELQELAYNHWVKAFGEYARKRMAGEI